MSRPGSRVIVIEGLGIDNELPCITSEFLFVAARNSLFRYIVIKVPQALLASDSAMTVEYKHFSLERPEKIINANKFLGHRFSQPNVFAAAFDWPAKWRIHAIRLCEVAFEGYAHRLQGD